MGLAYLKIDVDFVRDYKHQIMAEELDISADQALVAVLTFFSHVAEHASDGNLCNIPPRAVANWCQIPPVVRRLGGRLCMQNPPVERILDALKTAKWITNDMQVSGWKERYAKALAKRKAPINTLNNLANKTEFSRRAPDGFVPSTRADARSREEEEELEEREKEKVTTTEVAPVANARHFSLFSEQFWGSEKVATRRSESLVTALQGLEDFAPAVAAEIELRSAAKESPQAYATGMIRKREHLRSLASRMAAAKAETREREVQAANSSPPTAAAVAFLAALDFDAIGRCGPTNGNGNGKDHL